MLRFDRAGRRWGALARRRFDSGGVVDQIGGPRVRNHGAASHDEDQRDGSPEADDVVPVEIARFTADTGAKQQHGSDAAPTPAARHPKIDSGKDQKQKSEIARTRDGAAGGAPRAFHGKPAVPVGDRAEEVPRRRVTRPKNPARIGIHVDVTAPAEWKLRWAVPLCSQSERGGQRPLHVLNAPEQVFWLQATCIS